MEEVGGAEGGCAADMHGCGSCGGEEAVLTGLMVDAWEAG